MKDRFITAVRMSSSGSQIRHITMCLTLDPTSGKTLAFPPKSIAELIVESGFVYLVGSITGSIPVEPVRDTAGKPHHIRTAPNGTKDDNLIKLPRF